MLILLVAVAWITAFIPMPRWLSVLISTVVLIAGTFLVLSGGMDYWWDRSMQPDQNDGLHVLLAGVAMLLSRAAIVLRVIAEILTAY